VEIRNVSDLLRSFFRNGGRSSVSKTGAFDFLHGVLSAGGAAEKARGNEADAINCSGDQD